MIEIISLTKEFTEYGNTVKAVDNVSFTLQEKGFVGIVGESGGGKTTLLNLLCKIDTPTSGEIRGIEKIDCALVFQDYQLLDALSIKDNLSLFSQKTDDEIKLYLKKVGLNEPLEKPVNKLSGGQKQRVAIARALLLDAKYIFADEPTGNLDSYTSEKIMEIFKEIAKEKLVVMISHNKELTEKFADRILTIKDGKIESDVVKQENEDLVHIETKEKEREICLKKIFKLRKATKEKVNSSKIFNVIFTFLLLIAVFMGTNIISTSKGEIISNITRESKIKMVDFGLTHKIKDKYAYIDDDLLSKIQKKSPSVAVCYEKLDCEVQSTSDALKRFSENKVYVTSSVEGRELLDNEVVFSYTLPQVNYLKACFPHVEVNNFDSEHMFEGEKILINKKEVTIKGIEKNYVSPFFNETNEYHNDFEEYSTYFYCNEKTYKMLFESDNDYIFDVESTSNKGATIDIKGIDSLNVLQGRVPSENNEILITENVAKSLFPGKEVEDVIGESFNLHYNFMGKEVDSFEVKISGISDQCSTSKDIYTNLIPHARNVVNSKCNRKVSVPTSKINKNISNKLLSYSLVDSTFISNEIEIANSMRIMIGGIILVVAIPLGILLFVFQGVNARQIILSNRRIIGIMKAMSFSKNSITKIFVADSIVQNSISLIVSLIGAPIIVYIVNYFLVSNGMLSFGFIKVKLIILLLMFIALIIVSILCIFVGIKNLDKKSDVDLVYER